MILPESFIAQYRHRRPPWGPLGYFVYKRTYAYGADEEWYQTVRRIVEGCYHWLRLHCQENNRPYDSSKEQRSMMKMYDLIFNMKFLPPGRGLFSMGTPILEKSGAAANNCGFVSTEKSLAGAAQWTCEMLMLGVGVGFDTLGSELQVKDPGKNIREIHVIEDSREGWANAIKAAILPFFRDAHWPDFDASKVRPAGSIITTFKTKASGPEPLLAAIAGIRRVLTSRVNQRLGEAAIVDVMNLVGKAIVAGNVRRSAEIALGSPHKEFRELKDYRNQPVWSYGPDGDPVTYAANHRWSSNNSVVNPTEGELYSIADDVIGGADLGVFWLDNAQAYARMGRRPEYSDINAKGCNPCAEQTLEDRELCCLVEVFPSRHDNYYDLQTTLKYAYLYGKAVTLIETHDARTNKVMAANRRIGCSMTGVVEAIEKFGAASFFGKFCDRGYNYIQNLDERYSEWLGVPRSIKTTSVKPSGTVSLLPGVSPGIHFDHSPYYYRTVRVAPNSDYLPALERAGYRIAEHQGQAVVYFPVRAKTQRKKNDVGLWEQLEIAAQMQQHWADNQVSLTATFPNSTTPEELTSALKMYRSRLKAAAFLKLQDHKYEHAPYQEIDATEYHKYRDQLLPLDLSGGGHEASDQFCDGEACEIS